ncbi:MAG: NnrU family protein [Mitsuaria chitosanitabida]|uniref:NnrU family protein n=1 Tax=Roseateles chitosanitabidus TaxID=65048 RepID=UPI001B22D2E9|nr:NnrU family protein [Roseateles chitosanitabidus]MBO9686774.1 NnrU family protein [Roseateles chitosanitabidus]
MWPLILGLILFLGPHSVRVVAPAWREARLAAWGEARWKITYSLLSALGLVLIVWGYGQARMTPQVLWATPRGLSHLTALLMLPALILIASAHVPRNHVKAGLGHPMVIGVMLWATAHLLANNTVADLVLFGAFLAWATLDFLSARRRVLPSPPPGTARGTAIAVVAGTAVWIALILGLHRLIIGVSPFPDLGA